MKTWIKAAAALALSASMAMSVSAAFLPSEKLLNFKPEEKAVDWTQLVDVPDITAMDRVEIKSSLATDNVSTVNLFDVLPMTTSILPANAEGGAFLSMAPDGEAYKLGALAINTVETAYTFKVYASNDADQKEWVEVPVTLDAEKTAATDGKYQIWMADKLNEKYFYYRIVFEAETELELGSIHLYSRRDNPYEKRGILSGMFLFSGIAAKG